MKKAETLIRVPLKLAKKIDSLKQHTTEARWAVIERLLEKTKEAKK